MAWPKGIPRKPINQLTDEQAGAVEATATVEKQEADALVDTAFADIKDSGDPDDKALYGAMYDRDFSSQTWEKTNPIAVPDEIRRANPGMRFRYRALDPATGELRKGDNYDGWQVYKSTKHPDGKRYGGDTILAMMPEELAEQRNERYQQESTDRVKDLQESQIAAIDRAGAELRAGGAEVAAFDPGYKVEGAGLPTGIAIGARRMPNKKTGKVEEQFRGYHPEELREKSARAAEDRAKKRSYSYPGQNKRG